MNELDIIKMLIIVIGKYAEIFFNQYFRKLSSRPGQAIEDFLIKAIKFSKDLRHPFNSEEEKIDPKAVLSFISEISRPELPDLTNCLINRLVLVIDIQSETAVLPLLPPRSG